MDLYFHIVSIILLWVCGCRCIPRPQHTSTTTSPATVMAPRSLPRSNAGWSSNVYTTNRTEGGSGTRVVFPNQSSNDGPPYHVPPRRHKPSDSPNRNTQQEIQPVELEPCDNEDVKLCEAEHYPKKYLEDLLVKSGVQFRALFGTDFFESEEESKDGTLITRIDGLGESTLCQSTQELIRPTKGEDVSGVTRIIINQDNFTQGIRIEKCVEVGSACQFADIFPIGYIATCKQKHIHRKLAALNDNNEVEWMFFPIPSCCMCMYRSRRPGRSLPMSKITESGGESTCGGFGDLVPFGYETYCKQKYSYRKMLALDDDGSLQLIQFPLPTCCMCMVISSVHSLRSRLGFSPRLSKFKITNKFT